MTKLTGLEANVLQALREAEQWQVSCEFFACDADAAFETVNRVLRVTPSQWSGVLGSLQRKNLYRDGAVARESAETVAETIEAEQTAPVSNPPADGELRLKVVAEKAAQPVKRGRR
jgi:hypothetical protein